MDAYFWSEDKKVLAYKLKQLGYTNKAIAEELNKSGHPASYHSVKSYFKRLKNNEGKVKARHGQRDDEVVCYKPLISAGGRRVLVAGDIHAPFQHKRYTDFLVETYSRFKCDTFVSIGDEADYHSISRWPTETDALGKVDEYEAMIKYMKDLYEVFPEAYVCISNHTTRPLRAAKHAGVPDIFMKKIHEYMQAPDSWTWHPWMEIDDVRYEHGEGWAGEYPHVNATIGKRGNFKSTVIGHHHCVGGVEYLSGPTSELFALATGCGVDLNSYASRYRIDKCYKRGIVLGCGVVIGGREGYFIPLKTN